MEKGTSVAEREIGEQSTCVMESEVAALCFYVFQTLLSMFLAPGFFCLFTSCFDPPIPSQVVLVLCFVLWRFFWMCSLCFLYILITVFDLFYWVGLRFEPNPTYSILDSTYFILIARMHARLDSHPTGGYSIFLISLVNYYLFSMFKIKRDTRYPDSGPVDSGAKA